MDKLSDIDRVVSWLLATVKSHFMSSVLFWQFLEYLANSLSPTNRCLYFHHGLYLLLSVAGDILSIDGSI